MAQNRYINPTAVPRPTGGSRQDFDALYKFLYNVMGELSFRLEDDHEKVARFMKNLKLGIIATHVADAHTCVLHPASSTHRQLSDEELVAAGVGPDLIRLSCGIEHVDDIIEDLKQALDAI